MNKNINNIRFQIKNQIDDNFFSKTSHHVRKQLTDRFDQVWEHVDDQIRDSVRMQVKFQMWYNE